MKTISILGCGWFGFALAQKLINLGYKVNGSTTTDEKLAVLNAAQINAYLMQAGESTHPSFQSFFNCDVLFICIPPKRNSPEINDYPQKIKTILAAADKRAKQVVLISSTGVYGDSNQTVNELSETHPDTDSGRAVLAAEQILQQILPLNFSIIRFAGLFGPNRHPGRFFAGKTDVPNGLAPVNLIHQQDAVGIAISLIQQEAYGRIYNAVSPNHPTKMDFYTAAADDLGVQQPTFIAEKKNWKVVESLHIPQFLPYVFEVVI